MKITLLPHDRTGIWSVIFCFTFTILILMKIQNAIALPTPAIAALGMAGFFLGIFAIVVGKNRSLLTFLSIPLGLLILIWIAGEIVFSH